MDPYPTPKTHSLCGDPQGSVSLHLPFSIHVNHKERWPKAICPTQTTAATYKSHFSELKYYSAKIALVPKQHIGTWMKCDPIKHRLSLPNACEKGKDAW